MFIILFIAIRQNVKQSIFKFGYFTINPGGLNLEQNVNQMYIVCSRLFAYLPKETQLYGPLMDNCLQVIVT